MGLDITAYSNLKPRPDVDLKALLESEEERDLIIAFAYDAFPRSTRGLMNHDVKTHLLISGDGEIAAGAYEWTPATQSHGFRAGSYGGYSMFREMLADMVGHTGEYTSKGNPNLPFYELIWFADNEGCIGPEAAKDLLEDFQTWRGMFARMNPDWAETYDDWIEACKLAAENGLIEFH